MCREPLGRLLLDEDSNVAVAALGATRWPDDGPLLETVVGRLQERTTAGAAAAALVRAGDQALAAIDEALADDRADERVQDLLIRVARDVGSRSAVEVLRRHAGDRDREVGLVVLTALAAVVGTEEWRAGDHEAVDVSPVIRDDLEHATRTLRALGAIAPHPRADGLWTALQDELNLLGRRVFAALAVHYGADALDRVAFQFAKGDHRSHALALEWLDVTLRGTDRAAVALIESGLSDAARRQRLARDLPLPDLPLADVLLDLATDDGDHWRQPWLRACAIHAGWSVPEAGLDLARVGADVRGEGRDGSSLVEETRAAIGKRVGHEAPSPATVAAVSGGRSEQVL